MASLNRTLSLAQVDDAARRICHHLKLDVSRSLDELLEIDRAVTEGGDRLALRALERVGEFALLLDAPHPATAPARTRLHEQGISDRLRRLARRIEVRNRIAARHDGHARDGHPLASGDLEPHRANHFRSRSDERDPRRRQRLREFRVLRKKAVARMDGIGARTPRDRDDPRRVQIALRRSRRPATVGLVGVSHVQRIAVRLGIDGHRPHAQHTTRAHHPNRRSPRDSRSTSSRTSILPEVPTLYRTKPTATKHVEHRPNVQAGRASAKIAFSPNLEACSGLGVDVD